MDSQIAEFKSFMNNYLRANLLVAIHNLVIKSKVCPETNAQEWMNTLIEMDFRGYLYLAQDKGVLTTVVGAYRIPEFNNKFTDNIPEKEDGSILYVSFMVNNSQDKLLPRKLLNNYLKNNRDIKEVIFFKYNDNEKYTRLKVNQEEENEQEKSSSIAVISAESLR